MATYSNILAWRISWTEEPGGLWSIASHNSMGCSPAGSPVPGILQARTLEWVGPPGSSVHGDSPGKNIGVGCHALLQGIFPTRGSNPSLPHCRQILYHLSHPEEA